MYRFVETIDGDLTSGYTRVSIRSMKHIPKVGDIKEVKGYTYKSKRGGFESFKTAVAVIGDKGRIRLEGLNWGYQGEGPRGLQKLFDLLEVNEDAKTIALSPEGTESKVYWSIDIPKTSKQGD